MPSKIWPYITPGIPDDLFDRLPGIPLSQREIRLLLISHLRLQPNSLVWDIGAGTGTIPVEIGLLCPQARIIAVERDWRYLPLQGRVVATASNLESLYAISQALAQLQARNIEVVQSAVNRLEMRGSQQTFAAVDPIFILSGEKLD